MTKILTRDDIESICLVLIFLLLAASIICSFGIGERVYAACFYAWNFPDAWKYYGNKAGLGINADMSITALFFCLFGATVSMLIVFLLKDSNRKWVFRSAVTASIIYFMNGLLLFVLVKIGLVYLYCGRV